MNWTEERVELLKKLWSEGLSASQIAAQLGGVSRNAVIGKVHRLKLSGRGKSTSASPRARKPAATTIKPVEAAAPTRASTASTTTKRAAADKALSRPAPQPAPKVELNDTPVLETQPLPDEVLEAPEARHLTLLQLNERTCKWPIGDPLSEDFYFCGADSGEGTPYCAYHSKVAFQPATERRRVAR